MLIASIRRRRIGSTGIICDQTISLDGFYTRQDYPELLRRHPLQGPRVRQDAGLHHQQLLASGRHHLRALPKAAGRWNSSSSGSSSIFGSSQFYGTSENAVKTQIWIAVSVYVLVAIVKKRLDLDASLYTLLQILSVTLFEKMPIHQAIAGDENRCNASQITNQLNLFDF